MKVFCALLPLYLIQFGYLDCKLIPFLVYFIYVFVKLGLDSGFPCWDRSMNESVVMYSWLLLNSFGGKSYGYNALHFFFIICTYKLLEDMCNIYIYISTLLNRFAITCYFFS